MRDLVGSHGNDPNPAQCDHRKRDGVVAGEDEKSLGHSIKDLGNLRHVAAGLFYSRNIGYLGKPRYCAGLKVGRRPSGHVVENDWLVDSLGYGFEVLILTFLRGLVVIRRRSQDRIHPGPSGNFLRFGNRIAR